VIETTFNRDRPDPQLMIELSQSRSDTFFDYRMIEGTFDHLLNGEASLRGPAQ
jgi:hypothetical protein